VLCIEETAQCRDPTLFLVWDFPCGIAEDRITDSSNELAPVQGDANDCRCPASLTQMAGQCENFPEPLLVVRGMDIESAVSERPQYNAKGKISGVPERREEGRT
jgi:hypothetical protein